MRFARRLACAAVVLVLGCSGSDLITQPSGRPYYEVLSGNYTCPPDAPSCRPMTQAEKDWLRDAVEMYISRAGNCIIYRENILAAIDEGRVDIFGYFVRANGSVPLGTWDYNNRFSFNEKFFIDPYYPGWGQNTLGWVSAHEGYHQYALGGTEAEANYAGDHCVDN